MALNIKLDNKTHVFVLVWGGNTFGFSSLTALVSFIEEQTASVKDGSKLINSISTAMSEEKDENFAIYDYETYADMFLNEDDEDEDA